MLAIKNAMRSRLPSAYPKLAYERPHPMVYVKKNHDQVLYQDLVYRRMTGLWACITCFYLFQMGTRMVRAFGSPETSVSKIDSAIQSMVMFGLALAVTWYVAMIRDRHIQWLKDHPLGGVWPRATLERERHGRLAAWSEQAAVYLGGTFVGSSIAFVLAVQTWTMALTVCILGAATAVTIMRRNRHRRLAQPPIPAISPGPNKRPDLRLVK